MQSAAHMVLPLCKTRHGDFVGQVGRANVPYAAGLGAALVVRFATPVVFGSGRLPYTSHHFLAAASLNARATSACP